MEGERSERGGRERGRQGVNRIVVTYEMSATGQEAARPGVGDGFVRGGAEREDKC